MNYGHVNERRVPEDGRPCGGSSPINTLEAYYLMNAQQSYGHMSLVLYTTVNAWVMNNYYITSGTNNQNFLGCEGLRTHRQAGPSAFLVSMMIWTITSPGSPRT